MNRFVVISGCSGGGKSTLLAALARRGYATVEEPGRRIVREELASGGAALPWVDALAFLHRTAQMALADLEGASGSEGWMFFDRGLVDAASALEHLTGEPALAQTAAAGRYHRQVFLTPPWPEIYVTDPERRHGLADALPEYDRLLKVYPALGYEVTVLPRESVRERANRILATLDHVSCPRADTSSSGPAISV
jgi:predicted ATPase